MTGILNALIAGVSGAVKDTYFNLVSLLLPGNGTNGAQNNTFLDSSTNNFTITRNGDTTQGTFSPFSQTGWGAYFDGSNDYVSMPDSSAFSLSSSNWTMECWVYPLTSAVNRGIVGHANSTVTVSSSSFLIYLTSTNQVVVELYSGSSSYVITTTTTVAYNQWSHIAVVRDGNTARVYINGQQATGGTVSVTGISINDSAAQFALGRPGEYNSWYFLGNMSNFRLVNGTCLYPNGTQFTPSTTPLTTTSQGATSSEVKLLTLQNNRFIDNATTPNTLTANNGVAITPFSPFAPTSSYSAAIVGGSGYFDGSGDYLSIADNAAFTMGTSDFTVEAWVYCTATDFASSRYIIAQRNASADTSISFAMNFVGGGARKVRLLCFDSGGASYEAACATDVLNLNEWTHIAGVRNGATLRIYVNGVQQGTANISTASLVDSDGSVAIGRLGDANFYYWLGYISNVRITKGGCLYPSGTQFTPPTAPLTTTVSAGTVSLLTNFTNAGVVDATAKNVLETEGNAQ
ncbi:MAG: LamG domain-containing protein, partial [Microbacteriaceae bacterium]|nr:LamG domain-containing protein [Microbacteriaceae bacterium]